MHYRSIINKLQSEVTSTWYSEVVFVQCSTVSGIKVTHVLLSLHGKVW